MDIIIIFSIVTFASLLTTFIISLFWSQRDIRWLIIVAWIFLIINVFIIFFDIFWPLAFWIIWIAGIILFHKFFWLDPKAAIFAAILYNIIFNILVIFWLAIFDLPDMQKTSSSHSIHYKEWITDEQKREVEDYMKNIDLDSLNDR